MGRDLVKEHLPELSAEPLRFSLTDRTPLGAVGEAERHMVPLEFGEAEILAGGSWKDVSGLTKGLRNHLVARTIEGTLAALEEQGSAGAGGVVQGRAAVFVSNGRSPAGLWCRSMLGTEGGVRFFPDPAFRRVMGHRLLEGLPPSEGGALEVCECCLMIGAAGYVPDARLKKQFSHAMSCVGGCSYGPCGIRS
jgi:hypothetical protein